MDVEINQEHFVSREKRLLMRELRDGGENAQEEEKRWSEREMNKTA